MKKLILILFCVPFIFNDAAALAGDSVSLYSYLDRRIFHSKEDITLKIQITNISYKNIEFDVYDSAHGFSSLYTTFQPVVYDMNGREAELIVPHKQEDRNVYDILKYLTKRRIVLAPEESFTAQVNLNTVYNLKTGITYRTRAFFMPDMKDGTLIRGDNELYFSVEEYRHAEKKADTDVESRALTPSEVVLLHLTAEKNQQWQNYLKYLKIDRYIETSPEYMSTYLSVRNVEKYEIEKQFINHITRQRNDYLLDFKISDEQIADNKAYVEVIVTRFGPRVDYRFKYRYTLEEFEGTGIINWLVVHLDATFIKGGEK